MPQMGAQLSLQDLLAQLGLNGPSGAPPQPYDASGDAGGPSLLAQLGIGGAQPAPAGGPMMQGLGGLGGGPSAGAPAPPAAAPVDPGQSAPMSAADLSSMLASPPPLPPKRGVIGDVLDDAFLGGSIKANRQAEYGRELAAYDLQVKRASLIRDLQAQSALPGAERPYAVLGGPVAITELAKLHAPMAVSADQRVVRDGQTTNAPTGTYSVDAPSGRPVNSITGAAEPSLGGDYSAKDGLIVSQRTGGVSGTYSTPQILAPGSVPNTFTPSVGGAGGGAQDAGGAGAAAAGAPSDRAYLAALGKLEGGGSNAARNGSSTGIYQFQPKTFAGLGGKNINDPAETAAKALQYRDQNAAALQSAGLDVTPGALYLAHQQGAAGATALLSADPSANAVQVLQQSGHLPIARETMTDLRKLAAFLRARLAEPSTWAGVGAGCAAAATRYPHYAGALGLVGFLAGGVAFLLKDGSR